VSFDVGFEQTRDTILLVRLYDLDGTRLVDYSLCAGP